MQLSFLNLKHCQVSLVTKPLYYGISVIGIGVCLGSNTGLGINPAR